MSNTIQGFPPIGFDRLPTTPRAPAAGGPSFIDSLKNSLDQAQQVQSEADKKVSDLVTGTGSDIHSAMIAVEKANLSFQLVMEVRNKIVKAYQDISQMQF
jgi:flagellar hook-basal body complex protein FliE